MNEFIKEHTGSFVNNMYQHLHEFDEIIHKVMKKDMYTYEHNNRLRGYTLQIGERLNLNKNTMEKLTFAALFHDIGKINVPDYILKKPGSLSEDEFNYIRMHPTDGKEMVGAIDINSIGDIIEQHHERIDGSGYPLGLKNGEILREAKIIAVADSYDAMTTDRPYRKAMSPNIAMKELERLVGSHYEKDVVEVFKSILVEQGILEE
ncbi:MAG: metal dependent phosphohydrolase [Clostridia bacterium]|nr:metal dependent phosphohydrolase [Clostridia bacterium]